jgi:DNA helicase-2/ATP-dependent DNA helicase PcrA
MSQSSSGPVLNEPQKSAALHESGPLLIFAGAGSGKTRTVIYRIANLIANHRVPPYRILAVTFTNKAAGEMRERLEQMTGPEIARDLWVGTFHGTCAKFLRRHHEEVGLERNFVIYDDSDQKAVLARIIKDLGLDDRSYTPKAVRAIISAAKGEGSDPAEEDLGGGFDPNLVTIGREYQAALKRSNAVDFDDLLLHILRIVENEESEGGRALRRKFDHVLVDEFQDTNLVQYRIVRALTASSRNLCVVGDDDQSIYRWRGADVRIIRGFKRDFPETLVVKLEQNYRSTKNIVAAALGVIAPANDREPKELWTAQGEGDKVQVHACSDERVEAAFVTQGIQRALKQNVVASDCAIFYRTHAQSRVLEESLRGAKIAYQIIGGMKFFERAEVKDMLAYLRLIANPASDTDFLRIVNVPARGIGSKTVSSLLELAAENATSLTVTLENSLKDRSLSGAGEKKLGAFHALFSDLLLAKANLSPGDLLERILEATGYQKLLEKEDSAESDARLQNLAELVGSLREYEAEAPETGEEMSLEGYLERVSLVAAVDSLEDAPKVSLMTVHSSKGLEFERVWITGMEEETFPFRGMDGEDPEELDEERRLAYVAITRARSCLVISHAGTRFIFGRTKYLSPSRFLDDLPAECVERSGESRPHLPGFTQGTLSGLQASPAWTRRGGGEDWGATRGRSAWGGREEPASTVSPGGRSSATEISVNRSGRPVDREAFDDLPPDEFAQETYDDVEPLIVRPGQKVRHKKFGAGVVERVEAGAQPTVVARFAGYGPKRIVAEYLEFE